MMCWTPVAAAWTAAQKVCEMGMGWAVEFACSLNCYAGRQTFVGSCFMTIRSAPRNSHTKICSHSATATAAAGTTVQLVFGRGLVDLSAVEAGQLVWKNKDHALEGRLRSSYEGLAAAAQRRLPVSVGVQAALGAPLRLTLTDSQVCVWAPFRCLLG